MGTTTQAANLTVGSSHFTDVQIARTRQVGAFTKNGVDGSLGVPRYGKTGRSFLITRSRGFVSKYLRSVLTRHPFNPGDHFVPRR